MDMEALRAVIMADSPLAFFRLYETGINAPANEGSIPMTCSWQGGAPQILAHPEFGSVIKVNSAEWVKLEGGYSLSMVNGATIEALVQADSHKAWSRLFEIGTTVRTNTLTLAQSDVSGTLSSTLGGTFYGAAAGKLEYRKLTHIAVTHNPTTGRLQWYINGVLALDMAQTGTAAGIVDFQLGNLFYSLWAQTTTSTDQKFDGYAVYVAAYHGILTPEKIKGRTNLIPDLGTDVLGGIAKLWFVKLIANSRPIPANQEPRSQFQPQDVAWRGTPPMYAGPLNRQQQTQIPLCKGRDYFWIRDGVRNVEQGYIESTVTINGVGVRRRVLCFTQDGELVGETWSRASDGVYRFDLLWLNRRYMVVAQDDPVYGPADYNAVAADYQAPTPYPPGVGVAPFPSLS